MSAQNDLSNIFSELKNGLLVYLSPDNQRKIGNFAAELIRVRTRLGYGVSFSGGPREKLLPLSPSYQKYRKQHSNELYQETTAKKSNLTYTGQMLNSLGVIKVEGYKTVVGPHGYRKDGMANEYIANIVSKKRPFNTMTDKELLQLDRYVQNDFVSYVKRVLTK